MKKALALFLAFVMLLSLLPTAAFAMSLDEGSGNVAETNTEGEQPKEEPKEEPQEEPKEEELSEAPMLLGAAPVGTPITQANFSSGALVISASGTYYLNANVTGNITVNSGVTVTLDLNGFVLKGTGTGSVITNNGTLTLKDSNTTATHTGGYASLPAGGIITGGYANGGGVNNSGTFTMFGGTITACKAPNYGGGVYNSGNFTMKDGAVICKCEVVFCNDPNLDYQGGGVYINGASAKFTMEGGKISECSIPRGNVDIYYFTYGGGGVCIEIGTFEMKGGTISGCDGGSNGGAVFVQDYIDNASATFNMSAGTITGCKARKGGGVCVKYQGKFTMSGGIIEKCEADYNSGGGVALDGKSPDGFTMNGGTIAKCTAKNYGGGVFISRDTTFTMNSGTITECNAAEYGGGVYLFYFKRGATFNMYGGTISNNTASKSGGGVHDDSYEINDINGVTVTVGGTANITGNKCGTADSNLYLQNGTTVTVSTVKAPVVKNESKPAEPYMLIGVTLQNGIGNVTAAANKDYSRHFTSDNPNYGVINEGSGSSQQVKLVEQPAQIVETGVLYGTVQLAINNATKNQTVKILHNVTENVTVESGKDITLDLNGYVLNGGGNGTVITNKGTLTVTSSNTTREHKFKTTEALWVWDDTNGTVTVKGGVITGGRWRGHGGGILNSSGTMTLTSCMLTGNTAMNGCCVSNVKSNTSPATLTMENCTVSGNVTTGGSNSSVYAVENGNNNTLTMKNCTVTGNTAGVQSFGILTLGGNTKITDNTSGGAASNLWAGKPFTLASDFSGTVGVNITEFRVGLITGVFTTNGTADDVQYFTSDSPAYKVKFVEAVGTSGQDGYVAAHLELVNFELSAVAGNTAVVTLENDSMTDTQAKAIAAKQMPNTGLSNATVIAYAKDKDFATNGKYLTIKADSTNPWAKGDAMTLAELVTATGSKDVFVIGHACTYTASKSVDTLTYNDTITVTCSNSDYEQADKTIILTAADVTYDGYAHGALRVAKKGDTTEATSLAGQTALPTIEYFSGETKLDGAPKAAGKYTAKITVTYGESKSATAEVEFSIYAKAVKKCTVTFEKTATYNGSDIEPTVTVKDTVAGAEATLEKDKDYTVSYKNNLNAGNAVVTVKGIGNYQGTFSEVFVISPKAITVTTKDASKTYGEDDPDFELDIPEGALEGEDELVGIFTRAEGEDVTADGYIITYTPTEGENKNYAITVNNTGKLTINKYTENKISDLICSNVAIDEPPAPTAKTDFGEIKYTYSKDGENWGTWEEIYDLPGEYIVKAYVEDCVNYNGCEDTVTFEVKKCEGYFVVKFNELMPGYYTMLINDVDTGVYDFDMVVGGYTIRRISDGMYVCFDNGSIVYRADNPTVWAKDDAAFHVQVIETTRYWLFGWRTKTNVTEYYLNADANGNLTTSKLPGITHFAFHIEKDHHSYVYTFNGNGTHTCTCAVCGYSRVEDCTYGDGEHCIYCGSFDITKAGVKSVEVSVDKTEVGGGLKFVGWKLTYVKPYTTYTAHIYAYAEGTTVSKVEYSTDGANYADGSVYTSASAINALYIRVTDANGAVTYWLYENGKVTQK